MSSQKDCTTGSGPPNGRIWSAPVIMPSTPMKRVSRPTRIAFSAIRTSASASAERARQPEQLGEDAEPARADVPAASTVRGPSRKSLIASSCANAESDGGDAPAATPATIGR